MSQQVPGGLSEKDEADLAAMKHGGGAKQGWRYSPLFGVMYGNVPVGIIGVVVIGIIWLIVR